MVRHITGTLLLFACLGLFVASCGGAGAAADAVSTRDSSGGPTETQVVAAMRDAGLSSIGSVTGAPAHSGHPGGCRTNGAGYSVAGMLPQPVSAPNPSGGVMLVWSLPTARAAVKCVSPYFHRGGVWREVTSRGGLVVYWIAFTAHDARKLQRAARIVARSAGS